MRGLCLACFALCAGLAVAQEATESSQEQVTEHPTVILKQINEINEDGTYTVGYEATDGTFKLETRDEEGNVEGKYGFLDENGDIQIVEYSANNATGFTSDAASVRSGPTAIAGAAPVPVTPSPAFALEQQRHAAVIAHQARVIEKQEQIARQRDDAAQRQAFAAQRGGQQQRRRPVFNAAQFNPNRPASEQFNTQNFNSDFQQFQQQQQFQPQQQQQQFQPQQQQQFQPQQQQQFAPRQQQQFQQQPQQFQQQPQRPAFESQFQQFQAQQQQQQQQQQFAPQQFQQQPQQFQQQPQQFQQQPQAPALIPTSELTLEDIALEGFSRDEDQDGQIDPLPAHLQPALPPQQPAFQPQQFGGQPQQFGGQPQQFGGQPQQQFAPQFRQPAPVGPSPAGQQFAPQPPQLSQAQLNQFFQQSQQQQQQQQTQFQG